MLLWQNVKLVANKDIKEAWPIAKSTTTGKRYIEKAEAAIKTNGLPDNPCTVYISPTCKKIVVSSSIKLAML